jgi:hypothetical protein
MSKIEDKESPWFEDDVVFHFFTKATNANILHSRKDHKKYIAIGDYLGLVGVFSLW